MGYEQLDLLGNEKNDMNDIKEEIKSLREKIEYHNKRYYEEDEPEISDYEYDKLTQRLKKLEKEHPEFVDASSPTQKVGGKIKKIFGSVEHSVQMQSLQDVFSIDEVKEFVNKVKEEYQNQPQFIVETKIDGLSISLEYKDGIFVRGSTRGDGFVGEDVTENLKCIKSIPQKLNQDITIEVRGEVYLPRAEFARINEELEKNKKTLLSNPRNAAAGTLRQLDSKLVEQRNLDIFVFTVLKGPNFKFDSERLDFLDSLGFKTIEKRKVCKTDLEVLDYIEHIGNLRDSLAYDIDGAVINVDDLNIREELGKTVKVPKWSVAYKYPPEQRITKILDIVTQVGRTGQVTPMAILNPVRVAGSVISKTTLHNFDYIKQKDIRINDMAVIEKAGDVIPEVTKVLKEKRTGEEKEYVIPKNCPVCGEELEKEENQVALRCTNSECPACIYRSIIHFASRDAMDISGLGESIVDTLLQNNLISDIADLYYLNYEDILRLEGFKEKSARNLIDAINLTKTNTLDKLIFGMGIRYIGKKSAKILAENFNDIYEIMDATEEDFNNLDDIGTTMAKSLVQFFNKKQTKDLIEKFKRADVNLKGNKKVNVSDKLSKKSLVITGSFENFTREQIVKLIEENGGKASGSVSKKTDFLIAGDLAGSKLKKAQDLGVKVISIEEFLDMIK